jgi:hypothetical protein
MTNNKFEIFRTQGLYIELYSCEPALKLRNTGFTDQYLFRN